MPRRLASARRVKRHHTYTVEEAAAVTGYHRHTVRRWIESGALVAATERRPYLIPGRFLQAFLIGTDAPKCRLKAGECFCVKCRDARRPALDMADYVPVSASMGNLRGICPVCEILMHRRVPLAKLPVIKGDLEVTIMNAEPHLGGRSSPSTNVDSGDL